LALVFAGACARFFLEEPTLTASQLKFWYVGQGDFISYITPSECIFVDPGGSFEIPEKTLLFFRTNCREKPTSVFISHFHRDHYLNLDRLAKHLKNFEAYVPYSSPLSFGGKIFLQKLMLQAKGVHVIRQGFDLNLSSGANIKCLWPPRKFTPSKDENDNSLVLLLKISQVSSQVSASQISVLLTGDISKKVEPKLEVSHVDILKVGHHGSRTASSPSFHKRLTPLLCPVSVGFHNRYGLPHLSTIDRLVDFKCLPWRTDHGGSLTLEL
jgi:competence protein ComEC